MVVALQYILLVTTQSVHSSARGVTYVFSSTLGKLRPPFLFPTGEVCSDLVGCCVAIRPTRHNAKPPFVLPRLFFNVGCSELVGCCVAIRNTSYPYFLQTRNMFYPSRCKAYIRLSCPPTWKASSAFHISYRRGWLGSWLSHLPTPHDTMVSIKLLKLTVFYLQK